MASDAKDRAETRDYYSTHPLGGRGVVRDVLSCLDELDEAYACIAELKATLTELEPLRDARIAELEAKLTECDSAYRAMGTKLGSRIAELEHALALKDEAFAELEAQHTRATEQFGADAIRIAELEQNLLHRAECNHPSHYPSDTPFGLPPVHGGYPPLDKDEQDAINRVRAWKLAERTEHTPENENSHE